MDLIKLNGNYSLAMQPAGKKIRMVVYMAGVEKVCRLETKKNLRDFIYLDEGHIFKGRLRLQKQAVSIKVMVKGEIVGIISEGIFLESLNCITLALNTMKLQLS